jgi:hypothetical protein
MKGKLSEPWWDLGINPVTGYENSNYIGRRELKKENRRQEKKYIIVYPSLTTIQNIQSKRLSDNIYDKRN